MSLAIRIALLIGFLLSTYAAYVEYKHSQAQKLGTKYTALCDFGMFSCTKVFSSEFGYVSQFFGLPKISNAFIGQAFYVFELIIVNRFPKFFVFTAGCSVLGSVGLFYLLTVTLRDFCVVCMSIYVVNIVSFILGWRRLSKRRKGGEAKTASKGTPKARKME